MTLVRSGAEGGTNGATVAITDPSAFGETTPSQVIIGAGSTLTYDNSAKLFGSQSFAVGMVSGQATLLGWSGFNVTSMSGHICFLYTGAPSATTSIIRIQNTTTGAARVALDTAGKLRVLDSLSALKFTSVNALTVGWWRAALAVVKGTTTTNGTIVFAYYPALSSTARESYTPGATVNGGQTNLVDGRFGKAESSTWAGTLNIDEVALNDGTSTLLAAPDGPGLVTQAQTPTMQRIVVLPRAATQAQTVAMLRQLNLPRSVTQGQTPGLSRTVSLPRAVSQPQTPGVTRRVSLTKTVSQGQTVALARLARINRAVTQATTPTVARTVGISRSVSQPQTATVSRRISLARAATQTATASLARLARFTRTAAQATAATLARLVIPGGGNVPYETHGLTFAPVVDPGRAGAPVVVNGTSSAPAVANGTAAAPVVANGSSTAPVVGSGRTSAPVVSSGLTTAPVINNGQGKAVVL